jgi:hypothetical protein
VAGAAMHRERHAGAISCALQLALFLVGQQDLNNFFSLFNSHALQYSLDTLHNCPGEFL